MSMYVILNQKDKFESTESHLFSKWLQIWIEQFIQSLTSPSSRQRQTSDYRQWNNFGNSHLFVELISDDDRSEASSLSHP